MSWYEKNKSNIAIAMILFFIIFMMLFLVYLVIQDHNDDMLEIVEGKIVEVEYLGHPPKGSGYFLDCDIFKITFDNGKQFTIATRKDLDLTVNSRLVMHFFKDNSDWLYWDIQRIIKIPLG